MDALHSTSGQALVSTAVGPVGASLGPQFTMARRQQRPPNLQARFFAFFAVCITAGLRVGGLFDCYVVVHACAITLVPRLICRARNSGSRSLPNHETLGQLQLPPRKAARSRRTLTCFRKAERALP